jgi:two-component system, LytTR family, response regulator
VRALIVDDEPLSRRGVSLRLQKFANIKIVGECGDGLSAMEKSWNSLLMLCFSMFKCPA